MSFELEQEITQEQRELAQHHTTDSINQVEDDEQSTAQAIKDYFKFKDHIVDLQRAKENAVVGDVHSTARGSGARYNAGKAPIELIPFRILADLVSTMRAELALDTDFSLELDAHMAQVEVALQHLDLFQFSGQPQHLRNALMGLNNPWKECAAVFDYGRRKYAEWNWIKGMNWSIPLACAGRHLMAMAEGQIKDSESLLPHSGHVMCNIVMLLTFIETYPEGNDLPRLAENAIA
jgi:hypothetical protein